MQQQSDHKIFSSINNYSRASFQQQQNMSKVLCNFTLNSDDTTDMNQNFTKPCDRYANWNDVDKIPDDETWFFDIVLLRASREMIENTLRDIQNFESFGVLDKHNDIDNCKKSSSEKNLICLSVQVTLHLRIIQCLQYLMVKVNVIMNYRNSVEETENCQRQSQEKRK